MDYVLDGYCGVFCGACPVMIATKAGKLNEDQQCYGCKSEKPTGFCGTCGIKACAINKGFKFCIECTEVLDCGFMNKFISDQQYPYGQCVLKNMELIQRLGLRNGWKCSANGGVAGIAANPTPGTRKPVISVAKP